MSKFNFNDYQKVVERAQSGSSTSVKVGFFKLKDDGDEALVRINCSKLEDLDFATVHTVQADGRWMRISCLNPVGSYGDNCPLCTAQAEGDTTVSKASKKIYVQMLCAYKDKASGQFSAAVPVVWERPAAFSRDIANKLRDFGDLRNVVLKVTRNGKAGDMKTTYDLGFVPVFDKPEFVPADFSAFANFNIAKHSYWEKTADEIETFLQTGSFPEVGKQHKTEALAESARKAEAPADVTMQHQAPSMRPQVTAGVQPQQAPIEATTAHADPSTQPEAGVQPQPAPVEATTAKAEAPQPQERPVRNFSGFSF